MSQKLNKKVFITGEKGHLGYLICLACERLGFEVLNDKFSPFAKHCKKNIPNVFSYPYPNEIDILDDFFIEGVMKTEKPNIVFHTAAYVGTDKCESSFDGAYKTNVIATYNLARILKKHNKNCLLVNFSTTATCDPMYYGTRNKITEDTIRGPKTWYGMTKWQGEQVIKNEYDKWINFLPVFLFGKYPYDTASIWAKIFVKSNSKKKFDILLDPNIHKQYEYAENMISIIMTIVQNKKSIGKDIVLTGSEIKKFGSFLETAQEEYEKRTKKKMLYKLHPDKDYLKSHVADPSLMYKLSGISESKYNKGRKNFKSAIKEVVESCIGMRCYD